MQRLPSTTNLTRELISHHSHKCTQTQTRTIFNFFRRNRKSNSDKDRPPQANPVLEEFLRNNPRDADGRGAANSTPTQPSITHGDLAPTSIFEDQSNVTAASSGKTQPTSRDDSRGGPRKPSPGLAQVALDPNPRARERWQRKMVIRSVTRSDRLSKTQFVKRTERELVAKSHNFKTSVKKLGPLARQISGKTVDDAITQMKFSKKKVAREVLAHLEHARDQAIVSRGMGLGDAGDGGAEGETQKVIRLKDGKKRVVTDASEMYIAQAWVGRGPYGRLPEYRARGRTNVLRPPWTHLSLQLKEEATRIREHQYREAKRLRRRQEKVWVPLPDRPLMGQRQWYSW